MDKRKEIKLKDLVPELAQSESEATGEDYQKCIDKAIKEAKKILNISEKEYERMFINR